MLPLLAIRMDHLTDDIMPTQAVDLVMGATNRTTASGPLLGYDSV
jgi:hypothetical protein